MRSIVEMNQEVRAEIDRYVSFIAEIDSVLQIRHCAY